MFESMRAVVTITVVATVIFVGTALTGAGPPDRAPLLFVVLVALNTLPLLAVRRNPLVIVAVFSVAYPLWVDAEFGTAQLQSLPTLVAIFAAGAWQRPLWLRATALLAPVWMMAAAASGLWDVGLVDLGYVALVLAGVWALGVVLAERQAYATALEARTAELQAARRELADRAVADERARIARELHDVIAHAMSVITVQAGVGAHLAGNGSDPSAKALGVIERTGRQALTEMRRMLTVLRDPDPSGPQPPPQPGLNDLGDLIERTHAAGVAVALETHGVTPDLPPGLDLAAFRVVQEALTNVVKHAPSMCATVVIDHTPGALRIEVSNPTSHPVEHVEPGQGLRGMAERVALYDGVLDTTADGSTFRISARFPIGDPP